MSKKIIMVAACLLVVPLHAVSLEEAYGPSRENFAPFALAGVSALGGSVITAVLIHRAFRLGKNLGRIADKLDSTPHNREVQGAYRWARRRFIINLFLLGLAVGVSGIGLNGVISNAGKNELLRNAETVRVAAERVKPQLEAVLRSEHAVSLQEKHEAELLALLDVEIARLEREKKLSPDECAEHRGFVEKARAGSEEGLAQLRGFTLYKQLFKRAEMARKQALLSFLASLSGNSAMCSAAQAVLRKAALEQVESEQLVYAEILKPNYTRWELALRSVWGSELPARRVICGDGTELNLPQDLAMLL